jgi:hypothetical protein
MFRVCGEELHKGPHPPGLTYRTGTATVLDDEARLREENAVHNPHLKYDPTGTIILVPQPSNDPSDPLVSPCVLKGILLLNISRIGHYGDATSSS